MIFRVSAVYERGDFVGFMKAYTNRVPNLRIMNKISYIACRAAGVVMIVSGLINIAIAVYYGAFLLKNAAIHIAMLLAGAFLLKLPVNDLSGYKMWNKYQGQGARIDTEFYEDEYRIKYFGNDVPRPYGEIKTLYSDDERFYLFVSEQSADIIRRDCFTQGNEEDFADFIAEKTGLLWEGYDSAEARAARDEDGEDTEEENDNQM